jgi:hypothetical protein
MDIKIAVEAAFVVVENPGTDREQEIARFPTFREAAMFYTNKCGRFEHWDVMKKNEDGTRTTEF